jgi:hypothetical protein
VAGAPATVTVPCVTPPIPIVDALSATLDIAGPVTVGDDGELEPHRVADMAAKTTKGNARSLDWLHSFIIQSWAARTGPLTEQWLRRLYRRFRSGRPLRLRQPLHDDNRTAVELQ